MSERPLTKLTSLRMSKSIILQRLKPKVILVPRKKIDENQNKMTPEMALAALRVPPGERSDQHVDAILAIVGKWKDFNNFMHTEQERREVCRRVNLEEKAGNQVLFKLGDDPDGWYLVFSGLASIYVPAGDDSSHANITPTVLALLKQALPNGHFKWVCFKGPGSEFGSTALTNNDKRNATIFIDEPTILLRVDPQIYKDTAAWFARSQLEKRAILFSHVPELQFLRESRELFSRLAENTVEVKLPTGTILNSQKSTEASKGKGFLLIEEGLLIKQRVVDFSLFEKKYKQKFDGTLVSNYPKGRFPVKTKTYGPKTMFPDPDLTDFVPYAFSMIVVEPAICHILKLGDLETMLLTTQIQKIRDQYRDEPNDEQVIKMWIERQEEIQWQAFKRKCVKEARKIVKVERDILNGQWAMRKSGHPKPIKDHKPLPPLMRAKYG